MIFYNVFDTEEEAIAAEALCYKAWKESKGSDSIPYLAVTTRWFKPVQRVTDSKWVYRLCPEGDQNHTQEAYSEDWFTNPQTV